MLEREAVGEWPTFESPEDLANYAMRNLSESGLDNVLPAFWLEVW